METIQYSLKNSKFSIDINLYKGKNGDFSYQYKYNTQKTNDQKENYQKEHDEDLNKNIEILKNNFKTANDNIEKLKEKVKENNINLSNKTTDDDNDDKDVNDNHNIVEFDDKNKSDKNKSDKNNDKYDNYCKKVYGVRSCIFYEINPNIFEIRYLDKEKFNERIPRSQLYIYIPKLIAELYTVIIVEYLEKTHTNEIVAIHSPRA